MYKTIGTILFAMMTISCATGGSEKIVLNHLEYDGNKITRLIIPFKAFSYQADYHVMAYFDNHEKYASVEAFIFEKNDGYSFRAIMTDHNQHQVDYLTVSTQGDELIPTTTKITRETKLTKGDFKLSKNRKDYTFSFELDEDSLVTIFYIGRDLPDEKYSGLTDPGGHSPDGGIPMMHRGSSSIGTKASYVLINSKKYMITEDLEKSQKPWFTAYKTYLTKNFLFSLIPAHVTEEVIQVVELGRSKITLQHKFGSKEIILNASNEISQIKYVSGRTDHSESHMGLYFTPSFPNLAAMLPNQNYTGQFYVSYDSSDEKEIYGDVIIEKYANGEINMALIPEFPLWAKENRKMNYKIKINDNKVKIDAMNEQYQFQ